MIKGRENRGENVKEKGRKGKETGRKGKEKERKWKENEKRGIKRVPYSKCKIGKN